METLIMRGSLFPVAIIAAMSRNRVIGRDGAIPWKIPADLQRFRELTLGHVLVMGRKTFESIGRPLPGRRTIIVSRQAAFLPEGTLKAASLKEALCLAEGEGGVFICGGGEIYRQSVPFAARIYLTVVAAEIEGDTFFPEISADDFMEIGRERISEDPPADFITLERVSPVEPVCTA